MKGSWHFSWRVKFIFWWNLTSLPVLGDGVLRAHSYSLVNIYLYWLYFVLETETDWRNLLTVISGDSKSHEVPRKNASLSSLQSFLYTIHFRKIKLWSKLIRVKKFNTKIFVRYLGAFLDQLLGATANTSKIFHYVPVCIKVGPLFSENEKI